MIEVTQSAASHIKEMLLEKKISAAKGGLRIAVKNGGCSGMQYIMSFDSRKDGDQIFDRNDIHIFVDTESLPFVDGSTIDYVDELANTGFKVVNPRAKQTCGCGTSFEV